VVPALRPALGFVRAVDFGFGLRIGPLSEIALLLAGRGGARKPDGAETAK
jgi:hypothetical protein